MTTLTTKAQNIKTIIANEFEAFKRCGNRFWTAVPQKSRDAMQEGFDYLLATADSQKWESLDEYARASDLSYLVVQKNGNEYHKFSVMVLVPAYKAKIAAQA
jgi:hypothetical protein